LLNTEHALRINRATPAGDGPPRPDGFVEGGQTVRRCYQHANIGDHDLGSGAQPPSAIEGRPTPGSPVELLHQLDPFTTCGGELVRTCGLVSGVRDGEGVGAKFAGDIVLGAAVPGTVGVMVGARLGAPLCPLPERGAVEAAASAVAVVAAW
jgi:hypothetical protein